MSCDCDFVCSKTSNSSDEGRKYSQWEGTYKMEIFSGTFLKETSFQTEIL